MCTALWWLLSSFFPSGVCLSECMTKLIGITCCYIRKVHVEAVWSSLSLSNWLPPCVYPLLSLLPIAWCEWIYTLCFLHDSQNTTPREEWKKEKRAGREKEWRIKWVRDRMSWSVCVLLLSLSLSLFISWGVRMFSTAGICTKIFFPPLSPFLGVKFVLLNQKGKRRLFE